MFRKRHSAEPTAELAAADNNAPEPLRLRRVLAKQLLPLAVILGLGLIMRQRIAELDLAHIRASLATVGPGQWALGVVLTAVSFWSLGQYDVVVHRLIGRETDARRAARTGMTAIAIGQTVGMGALTGAFVRWKMLPQLGLLDTTKVAAIVSLSFFAAWGVVSALGILIFGVALPFATPLAAAVLMAAVVMLGLSLWRPGPVKRLPLPSLKAMGLILAFTTIDVVAAGAVLWVMLPEGITVALGPLLAAYFLALGAGLMLTTPGGVGPFEVAMISLLPTIPAEPLLAAILAYRAVYYALPAAIAAVVLTRRLPAPRARTACAEFTAAPHAHLPLTAEAVLSSAPRAEAGLLRHGRFGLLSDGRGWPLALAAPTGQSLVMLGDPLKGGALCQETAEALRDRAELTLRAPVVYKCGGRFASHLRRKGWSVLPIAREAWIDVASYTPTGSGRRQMRRKLRKAEAAGITTTYFGPQDPTLLPLCEMDSVAAEWAARRGGERGFSMGTWAPDTLTHAAVLLARAADGRLLGFVTFHANAQEWTLDLMRQVDALPDGTMHLLIQRAIEAAQAEGVARLSLAAVPAKDSRGENRVFVRLRHLLDRVTGAGGLRQFKSAFDPKWETLYVSAPSRTALALGMVDIAREILCRRSRPGTGR